MLKAVTKTADHSGLPVGLEVKDESYKEDAAGCQDAQSGKFAEEQINESKTDEKKMNTLIKEIEEHQIENTGLLIRKTVGIQK